MVDNCAEDQPFTLKVIHREENTSTEHLRHLHDAAWYELVELGCLPRHEWVAGQLARLGAEERIEIQGWVDGHLIGGLVLSDDWDVHVGPCLSVLTNYTLPKYRTKLYGAKVFREAIRVAKELGYPCLAWTHRVGDWCYMTRYRRLKETA